MPWIIVLYLLIDFAEHKLKYLCSIIGLKLGLTSSTKPTILKSHNYWNITYFLLIIYIISNQDETLIECYSKYNYYNLIYLKNMLQWDSHDVRFLYFLPLDNLLITLQLICLEFYIRFISHTFIICYNTLNIMYLN